MRTQINFNHLECFFTLAQNLSFSKTSETLGIAQPAVSKQIKTLEENLSVNLFLRNKQKVTLSKYGLKLYEELFPLYQGLCTRYKGFSEQEEKIEGTITIGCLMEIGENLLIPLLQSFNQTYPSIIFDVHLLKSKEILEGIKQGELDLGIIPQKVLQESIRIYEIYKEKSVLVKGPLHTKAIKDFQKESFVSFGNFDPLLEAYIKQHAQISHMGQLDIRFRANSHRALKEIIKKGQEIGVFPWLSVRKELETGELLKAGPLIMESSLYLAHLDEEIISPKVKILITYLRNELKK